MRTELRDVRLVVFEITVRQLADEFALQLLIPAQDHLRVLDLRMRTQPLRHFVVARAGRDDLLELVGRDAGKLPQERGQSARMEVVLAVHAEQERPAFGEAARRDDVAAELLMRAGRRLFAQVFGECLELFSVHDYQYAKGWYRRQLRLGCVVFRAR